MKKLIITLISIFCLPLAWANNSAVLHLKIAGPIQNNRYFLCVNTMHGCVSIQAGNKGKTYPMDTGKVYLISPIDLATRQLFRQALPSSCKVNIQRNQTLNVSGQLVENKKGTYIKNLKCEVV